MKLAKIGMAGGYPLKLRLSIRLRFIEKVLSILSDHVEEELHADHR